MGILPKRGVHIIIIDEHVMYGARLAEKIEQYKKDLEEGKRFFDSCSMLMAREEPTEYGYEDDKYHNWKDFIHNPARPGRQIKKQKPPKQSFKAQMRSVNRNR